MLDKLNSFWVILICAIIFFIIVKKLYNLNKPFDESKFIKQYANQEKLKEKFGMQNISQQLPQLASMYVGIM